VKRSPSFGNGPINPLEPTFYLSRVSCAPAIAAFFIPADAGIHKHSAPPLDPGFRRDDDTDTRMTTLTPSYTC
jgi:hypothetical protein